MMDGWPLYPGGFHPIRRRFSPDAIEKIKPLSRMDHPVRYFYIDFGLSEHFAPGASSLVVGDVGRDAEVPELSSTVPYDGYKADIYALGNFFYKEFVQVCRECAEFHRRWDADRMRRSTRTSTSSCS